MKEGRPYAFISYRSKREADADKLREMLEGEGIPCWMASREIRGTLDYADVIGDALEGCACFVLLLTKETQESNWIRDELTVANNDGKPLFPIMLEEVELKGQFKLYLSRLQKVEIKELTKENEGFRKAVTDLRSVMKIKAPSGQESQNREKTPEAEADAPVGKDAVDGLDVVEGYLSLTIPALRKTDKGYELPQFLVERDDKGRESGPPVCGATPEKLYCVAEDGTETLWEQKRNVEKKTKPKELYLVSADKYRNTTLFKVKAQGNVALRLHRKFKKGDRVVLWGTARTYGSKHAFYVRRILKVEKDT